MLVSRVAITDKRSGCASLHLVLRIASCLDVDVKSSTWVVSQNAAGRRMGRIILIGSDPVPAAGRPVVKKSTSN